MRTFAIIFCSLLTIGWGYTCWFWYVCEVRGLCEANITDIETSSGSENIFSEDISTSEDETIFSENNISENSLNLNDVSSEQLDSQNNVNISSTLDNTDESENTEDSNTGSVVDISVDSDAETLSDFINEFENSDNDIIGDAEISENTTDICENPILGPIAFGAQNNSVEVQKLENFLNSRGENLSVDGVYGEADFEAVKRFQLEYRTRILDPWGIAEPTGYVFTTTTRTMSEVACNR